MERGSGGFLCVNNSGFAPPWYAWAVIFLVSRIVTAAIPAVDTADTAVRELETIVVSARRASRERSAVTEIKADEFQGKFADLSAVLEQVSGVIVRRTGGIGEYSDASIRGRSPKQVQVYLDGIPLNSAAGGAVDLSKISLNALRSITVYKGSAPMDLMGNTAGGVISLSSVADSDMVSGVAEYGSYGYCKGGMLARKKNERLINHFAIDYSAAQNNYEFDYDNNTKHNPDDDSRREKDNNAYMLFNASYSGILEIAPGNRFLSQVVFMRDRKEYFHKFLADSIQQTERTSENVRGFLSWENEFAELGYWGVRLEGRFEHRLFHDPLGNYYLSGQRKEKENLPYLSLHTDGLLLLSDIFSVRGRIGGSYEGYNSENLLAPSRVEPPRAHRVSGTGAAELEASWDSLTVSFRYNHIYSVDSANFTPNHGNGAPLPQQFSTHYPNANLDILFHVTRRLVLDAAARYEHLPVTLSDRYGWGNNYHGNPRLRPEKSSEACFGATLTTKNSESALAGFIGYTHDMIEIRAQSQRIIMAQNTGDMRFAGMEWDTRLRLLQWLLLDNRFTFIYKSMRDSGQSRDSAQTLLYYSPIENDFRITTIFGPIRASHSIHYRSPYLKGHTIPDDIVVPFPVMSAYATLTIKEMIHLTYRMENYLDEIYVPMGNYAPLPGRMHFFSTRILF
ncbi:MAG: TonB-dependent receptor [Chitinivibrionales bacterium]|nr:TonB-dependent receptor [Chitinivibrionales bacterium]